MKLEKKKKPTPLRVITAKPLGKTVLCWLPDIADALAQLQRIDFFVVFNAPT